MASKKQKTNEAPSKIYNKMMKLEDDDIENENEKLGEGGNATVWRGHLKKTYTPVAIKSYTASILGEKQFEAEKVALGHLKHDNIVKCFGYSQTEDRRMLVLEILPMKFTSFMEGLNWTKTLDMLIEAANALAYMHEEGFVFVDFKPENLMLNSEDQLKLVDFGGAILEGSNSIVSTKEYEAPELHKGNVSKYVDIYSYGVVMLQLLMKSQEVGDRKKNADKIKRFDQTDTEFYIVDRAKKWKSRCFISKQLLESGCNTNITDKICDLALKCVSEAPQARGSMTEILGSLKFMKEEQ